MMCDEGCKANTVSYNSLLNAYATKGDVDGAHEVLAMMRDGGSTATR